MSSEQIIEQYSKNLEQNAWLPFCNEGYIRNPFDLECYSLESEMGKFIKNMIVNLQQKQIKLAENKLKLERAGIIGKIQTTNISIPEFLNNYFLKFDNIDVFLDSATCESPGIAYEFLWKICIYFKICDDIFPDKLYKPKDGNSNLPDRLIDLDRTRWLSNDRVNTGSESGAADIILEKKLTEKEEKENKTDVCDPIYKFTNAKYILIQSKLIHDELRSVASDYDMTKIRSLFASDNPDLQLYYDIKPRIVLFVRNKEIVANKIRKISESNKYLFKNFNSETDIYDKDDLQLYYSKLKLFLFQFIQDDRYNFEKLLIFLKDDKQLLIPRLHQLITLFKTVDRLKYSTSSSSNTFLYGAVARSGKTYMMGELINYFNIMGRENKGYRCYEPVSALNGYDITKPFSFIIFSPVPNETITEYKNLFTKHKEFNHYIVKVVQGGDEYHKFIESYNPINNYIIIISKQTLDSDFKSVNDDENVDKSMKRLQELLTTIKSKNGEITGIFFDEHHVSGCSDRSQNMLSYFKKPDMFPNLFYVFITATYNKSIFNYKIPTNNQFTWNYEDIILCKAITNDENYSKLYKKHLEPFKKSIECFEKMGYNRKDIELEYSKFPNIYLLSQKWNEHLITDQLKQDASEINFGELLFVDQKTQQFRDHNAVDGLLRLIFGDMTSYKPFHDINRMCFLNRIRKISDKIGSRTLQDNSFTTQIWFLPIGTIGSGIESIANALEMKLNSKQMITNNYAIFNMKDENVVRGDQSNSYKEQIRKQEILAKEDDKKGLIILTGKQLSLGISLPCVDIVLMLNDITHLDLYYQMIFRSLTESVGKKAGFICDFNPDRAVSAIYGQAMNHNIKDPVGDARKKFINENFIYIDTDLVEEKNISQSELIEFFNSIKLTDLGGKNLLTERQIKDIDEELTRIIDQIDRDDIQQQLKRLSFDKVITTQNIKEKAQLQAKINKDQEDLSDLIAKQEELSEKSAPTKQEVSSLKTIEQKIEKKKQDIRQTQIKQSQIKDKIDIGKIIIPIIKMALLLTIHDDLKSVRDIFQHIFSNDKRYQLIRKKYKTFLDKSILDNIKDYLLLQGNYGPEKNQKLELIRIEFILELFNPENENNIIKSIETMESLQKNIEGLHEDIRNNLDSVETNIDNIEKVMTKKCAKNSDGKLVVVEDPSVDESSLESCDEIPSILQKKQLLKYFEENLTPIEELKKKTGEVFTPWDLIDEMMRTIPNEFWTNPNHKILEPGSGFGPFAIWAYYRLMVGLKDSMPDEEERRKHIVENMLYMAELNGVNVDYSRTIFSSNGLYRVNIYHGDFLELNPEEEWGVGQFDLICGNPPFQNEKSGKTAQGGHDLYPKFFIKSFYLLKNDGFLSFINPAKWRAPDKKGDLKEMWDIFVNNNAIFLKIYGFNETKKIFYGGAVTRIDYYVLQKNTREYNNTIIIDEENKKHKINLRDWNFLPNYDIDNIKRVLTDQDNGIKIIYSRGNYGNDKPHISKEKNGTFIYPVKHTHTIKDGDIYFWSNTNKNGHFGEKKVILGKGLYPYPYNDYNGDYGMSNYSFGIPITSKKEGDDIVEAINSEGFKRLISATKWSSGFTDHNMFKYFRPDFYKDFIGKDRKLFEHSTVNGKKSMLPKIGSVSDFQDEDEQEEQYDEDEEGEYEEGEDNQTDEDIENEESEFADQARLVGKTTSREEAMPLEQPVCQDRTPSVREYNATHEKYTETVCDVVYLFNTNDAKSEPMPIGYLTPTGKIKPFPEELPQQFDRCVLHKNPEICAANDKCKWIREKKPNPARCELDPKKYENKPELHKYNSYYNKSRKQSEGGKNNRKSKRYQKLKISKQKSIVTKNNRKSKRNLK